MKWTHLPNAGGLYDQDPELLRKFEVLFAAIDEQERIERDKQEAERKQSAARRPTPSRGARRRR